MRVVLASTSPARRMLLRQAGIEPELRAPGTDEDAVIAKATAERGAEPSPDEYVLMLARAKAADVAARLEEEEPEFDGIVIGGDSMFVFDGEVLGKPYLPEVAAARWRQMRGKSGVLHSGHCVYRFRPDEHEVHHVFDTASAVVTFASDITDSEIDAYVATGEPLHVAGAFTVDSLGGAFIERVDGDPSTVVGMSLSLTRQLVRALGVEWTSLWNSARVQPGSIDGEDSAS